MRPRFLAINFDLRMAICILGSAGLGGSEFFPITKRVPPKLALV